MAAEFANNGRHPRFFAYVLTNPLMMAAFSDYLKGFLLGLNFTPRIARFVAEALSLAEQQLRALLFNMPAATDTMAYLLGSPPGVWQQEIAEETAVGMIVESDDAVVPNEQIV